MNLPTATSQESSSSVWHKAAALLPPELAAFDATELEQAFATKPSSATAAAPLTPRSAGAGREYVNLLDHKRATNAGIALARLGLPHGGGLVRAILTMDESRLPLHKASSLLAVVPTAEEAELIRAYDGELSTLGSTERYFAELITIPRLEPRLHSWVVQMRFGAQVGDLKQRQQQLQSSLAALRACEPMHTALGALLALGNALNAGTARANASGFKLDASLTQMGTVRSAVGSTLMGFLARHIQRSAPGLVASLATALPTLAAACRLDADGWAAEMAALRADVTAVEVALRTHRAAMGTDTRAPLGSEAQAVAASIVQLAAGTSTGGGAMGGDDDVPLDAFEPVMVRFLSLAQVQLEEASEAAKALSEEAVATCTFYCEDDKTVSSAQALLERLHGFGAALVGAHEQQMSQLAAEEARANRPRRAAKPSGAEASPGPSTPTRGGLSTPGVSAPNGAGTPSRASRPPPSSPSARLSARAVEAPTCTASLFEASEESLRAILEDEERAPQEMDALVAEGGALKLRRTEEGREAPASPEELQALFQRRQAGLSIGGKLEPRPSPLGRAASEPLLPLSPGKRHRTTDGEGGDM